jgi:hypothetical protein
LFKVPYFLFANAEGVFPQGNPTPRNLICSIISRLWAQAKTFKPKKSLPAGSKVHELCVAAAECLLFCSTSHDLLCCCFFATATNTPSLHKRRPWALVIFAGFNNPKSRKTFLMRAQLRGAACK